MKRLAAAFGIALIVIAAFQASGSPYASKARSLVERTVGTAVSTVASGGLQAEYALVIDAETGKTIYAKNERERAYPASTTKIVTALLALELGKPDELVTVGDEALPEDPEESRAGLKPGQRLKLYDLVEAALLPSGNDAARTIAVHFGRKAAGDPQLDEDAAQREFAKLMNKRAKKAGATNTRFVNASGLHDPNHYTTARDIALIAKDAMANKLFRQAVRATDYTASTGAAGAGGFAKAAWSNTNQLLQPGSAHYFEGATGIKTGFTDQAGYCLVSSASKGGKSVIAVVLRSTSKDVYPDAKKLLELGLGTAGDPAATKS
ncbi:D-alanyl-D-alanine carboxypeptidase family protein [Paenibacillus flagellatus]|nr:D-alanyl-D-alanine carboxypeptidase [Paenibacillus flagellatus]